MLSLKDVGGKIFSTTIDTLTGQYSEGSLLQTVFSNAAWKTARDENGFLFVDRDGKYFHLVLNFLRDGQLPRLNQSEIESLKLEAKYYGLKKLEGYLDQVMKQKKEKRKEKGGKSTSQDLDEAIHAQYMNLLGTLNRNSNDAIPTSLKDLIHQFNVNLESIN